MGSNLNALVNEYHERHILDIEFRAKNAQIFPEIISDDQSPDEMRARAPKKLSWDSE